MKRALSIILAVLLLTVLLTGCPADDKPEPDASPEVTDNAPASPEPETSDKPEPEEPVVPAPSSFSFEIVERDDFTCFGLLTAYDELGNECWTYKTDTASVTELQTVQEIGQTEYGYLLLANGSIICLDVASCEKPTVLWKNAEFMGASAAFTFDGDGNLLICGYYGPDYMRIDSNGNTLLRKEQLVDSDYFWPYALSFNDDGRASILYESGEYGYQVDFDPVTGDVFAVTLPPLQVDVLYDYSGVYKDEFDNLYNFSYRVPVLTPAKKAGPEQFNMAMRDIVNEDIAYCLKDMEENVSLSLCTVSYSVGTIDDILSICVHEAFDFELDKYITGSFRTDGSSVTNPELLSAFGITSEQFVEQMRTQLYELTDYSKNFNLDDFSEDEIQMFKELQEDTLAVDNANEYVPLFIGEDGALHYVVTVFTPAGAGYYSYVGTLTK